MSIIEIKTKLKNGAIGYPPEELTKSQKAIWIEATNMCDDGFFNESQRHDLMRICILMDELRRGIDRDNVPKHDELIDLFDKCRMTPASRLRT